MRPSVYSLIVFILCFFLSGGISEAFRDIPEDSLAYPVLINTDIGGTGTGFFVNDGKTMFLVTARHLFYPPDGKRGFKQTISCFAYSLDNTVHHLILDLVALSTTGDFKLHDLEDVAVIRIGRLGGRRVTFLPGVERPAYSGESITSFPLAHIKTFDQVLVANEVYLFGYPVSLGLKNIPQLDHKKPLVRKGIIAGKNKEHQTLILDVPVYPGNSGGPVVEVEVEGDQRKFRVVGVAIQFVLSFLRGLPANSGYSVAVSMNPVLELFDAFSNEKPSSEGEPSPPLPEAEALPGQP